MGHKGKQRLALKVLSRNIRAIRKERKMTQEEAAFRSGIGYKRWQALEAGRSNTTLFTLCRIASVLKVSIRRLFVS